MFTLEKDRPIMLHGKTSDKLLMNRDTMLWRLTSIRANAVKIIIAIKPSELSEALWKLILVDVDDTLGGKQRK